MADMTEQPTIKELLERAQAGDRVAAVECAGSCMLYAQEYEGRGETRQADAFRAFAIAAIACLPPSAEEPTP